MGSVRELIFSFYMHVGYMCAHACGVLRLMVEIFNCSSILVTEARSPNQTQSSLIWLVLVSMFWGLPVLLSEAEEQVGLHSHLAFYLTSVDQGLQSLPHTETISSAIQGGIKTRKRPHLIACAKALPW